MLFDIWKSEFAVIKQQMLNEVGEFDKLDDLSLTLGRRNILKSITSKLLEKTGKILAEIRGNQNFNDTNRRYTYNCPKLELYEKIYEFHTKMEIAMAKLA